VLGSLTFLTPLGALVALVVVVPLAAFLVAARRVARVRAALALSAPHNRFDVPLLAAAAAVVLVLALAAAQPALSRNSTQRVRTDAAVLFVVDTSQSMAAAPGAHAPTRLDRAKTVAADLRTAIPEVPAGIATLTDRVLPNLLPVADAATFDKTLRLSLAIEEPPPRNVAVRATTFTALAGIPTSGYFDPSVRRRVVVLLTDGETAPLDDAVVGDAFAKAPRTALIAVRLWRADESIYDVSGRRDPNYRPDPASRRLLAMLASAVQGAAFDEGSLRAARAALRDAVGRGPTQSVGRARTTHPLAPYVAFAALVPLFLVFRKRAR
jgi:hypothetical protein